MAAPQPAATTQPATSTPALGSSLPVTVANPGPSSLEAGAKVDRASESAGQAAFNPFATIGTVVQQQMRSTPPAQDGDLSLPVLVSIVGAIYLGRLLRRLVQ